MNKEDNNKEEKTKFRVIGSYCYDYEKQEFFIDNNK